MSLTPQWRTLLSDPSIRQALKQAWLDSEPGPTGGHEEGGFLLRDVQDQVVVHRWPLGTQNTIAVPPHPACRLADADIMATFHTHPNTGPDYLQAPSVTDMRAVRDDPDLKGDAYLGELVLTQALFYLITPNGAVTALGTWNLLADSG